MRPRSYISVSGVTDANPLLDRVFSSITTKTEALAHNHGLAIGILVSEKTLYGEGNKYPNRYPTPAYECAWEAAAAARHCVLNFVHYCADSNDKLGMALVDSVLAVERHGRTVHGVQVNVHWPDPNELRVFASTFPKKRIILQVRGDLVGGWNPTLIATDLVKHYAWVITDVLLDGSGGRGQPLDVDVLTPVVSHLTNKMSCLGVGVAGGLCGRAFNREVEQFLRTYPHLSLDAEGALRDDVANGGGHLNLDKVVDYFASVRAILGRE